MHLFGDLIPDSIVAIIMTFVIGIPIVLLGLKWDDEGKNKLIDNNDE